MKRKLIAISVLTIISLATFAGGLVTNSNQSAAYVRMLARFGTTEIDGVYYNPAGLVMLEDGWHISLNNQFLFQTRTISSNFPTLNDGKFKDYEGKVSVPFFPSVHAAYKKGNLVYSIGISPIGGGGNAKYNDGLPMFDMLVSSLVPFPSAVYDSKASLSGSSMYLGYQAGVSYKINDMFGVFGGFRAVQAINSYVGDISVKLNQDIPTSPMGPLPAGTELANMKLDVDQTGFGFTPIIGTNINFGESFNLGLRYEFATKIKLTNDTKEAPAIMPEYADKVKSRADIPATLCVGGEYKPISNLKLALGGQYYFDKNANYNGREDNIDNNAWELSLGAEYNVTEKFLVSAGYLRFQTGVGKDYQNEISHSVSTNNFGLGGAYKLSDTYTINVGALYTKAQEYKVDTPIAPAVSYQTKYNRENFGFSIGVNMHF